MAALTMSFDQNACRYAAAVQTNGHRVEMITPANIRSMMLPLFEQWITKVGGGRGPSHIYYFRDGVSEGQYAHVLNNELADMKEALVEKYGAQVAGGVSTKPSGNSNFADSKTDQVDRDCLHQASSHPFLPQGR